MKRKQLLIAMVLLMAAAVATAGEISKGLQVILDETDDKTPVKAMIFLRERVDIKGLDLQLHLAKSTRADRHARVVNELRDTARATQGDLLAALANLQRDGLVVGFTPHWLVNGIVVVAAKPALLALSQHGDVDIIEADLVAALIEPVAVEQVPPEKAAKGIGITPGVVNIGARRVWDELGIRGEGALVGTLDTGVSGSHPALSARWRGNFAPWQHAWLDVLGTGTQFPSDGHGHGTHVTGTVTGLAPDDSIGVAPAAHWLACNAINQNSGSELDNDILAALAWFADPDGDAGTIDDVPDVVQNSWGVNETFSGYVDCDSRWWDAIDACEAAGVVLTWSAGNEGSASQSIRSPADRATTLLNCFSVGSTIAVPPFTISSFSSRGPAGPNCGPEGNRVKPEIVAPGQDIYSSYPGGGYTTMSGTSMAGPHLAGVVALMRSANPDLDVITIKQVLLDTAVDLGSAGEDNDYGHGLVDAFAAVLTVLGGVGYLEGTVIAADTGLPVAGALVEVVDTPRIFTADQNGGFRLILAPGAYDLAISAFGFAPGIAGIVIVEDQTSVETFELQRLPSATLSGIVYDPEGLPAVGASVEALGTPVPAAITDDEGFYSLLLPVGDTYQVRALTVGVGIAFAEILLTEDVIVDLFMEALSQESFETGDFAAFPWTFSGSVPWTIDASQAYHGAVSARSGAISHGQSTTMRLAMDVAVASELSFFYRVSSETNYDYLEFWLNGTRLDRWAGEVAWTEYTCDVEPGSYVFEWTYSKDGSVSSGSDAAWIDLITFPLAADPPQASIAPLSLEVSLAPDAATSEILTITNAGEAPLSYRLAAQESLPPRKATQRPIVVAGKDELVTGPGRSPAASQGGPDSYGYRWLDSNEPGGPLYDWVDISATGTVVTPADDATRGPFDLGFTFNFYGVDYTQVRICTNGFLTFENTTSAPYTNQGIPNSAAPNALVAMFWDDLNPTSAGTIYFLADAENERFIVQFQGVAHYGSSSSQETFQAILTPDGDIVCQYHTVANSTSCTVGIENTNGTDGLEVLYNTGGYLENGLALRFTTAPTVPWLSYTPDMGTVMQGESAEVVVGFEAAGLDEGVYTCELAIVSNDPLQGAIVVPVTMTVTSLTSSGGMPAVFVLHEAAPNPFNPTTILRFSLPAGGHAELKLYDVQGRLVRTLIEGHRPAGDGEARWDGRDQSGRRVSSGAYYARLTAGGQTSVKAMVLVK